MKLILNHIMKYFTLLLFLIALSFNSWAQDSLLHKVVKRSFNIDNHSVVKDSTGKLFTYKEWSDLMRTRKYVLWPENMEDANTAFILKKKDTRQVQYINSETAAPSAGTPANTPKQLSPEEAKEQYMASLPKPYESSYFNTGEVMEPFSTHDINGNKIKLKDLRGKVVVLNFWFIGCPACMQEIPELNKLVDDYKNNTNVVFLAIALDDRYELKKFLKQTEFKYDIIDDGRYIASGYKIGLYPTSVILDKEGKVAFHTVGFAVNSPYWMRKTINDGLK
ncbi:peroxiredoxin family protein [Mucilaginibacter kameinonensis]|uniref:peroxiredoxin family protein n=1 Tax=Mucilaginibacter kameinonensis TaxID=452286 RepID=UPI000EF78615|nr:TlpA disulfide reductase family protein [Mucilaginibacter kameinonensis]